MGEDTAAREDGGQYCGIKRNVEPLPGSPGETRRRNLRKKSGVFDTLCQGLAGHQAWPRLGRSRQGVFAQHSGPAGAIGGRFEAIRRSGVEWARMFLATRRHPDPLPPSLHLREVAAEDDSASQAGGMLREIGR